MRAATVAELAVAADVRMPVDDPADLYQPAYASLTDFLSVFWLVQSVLVDPDAWERLAFESIIDGAQHGLIYRETFFTPTRHLINGQSLADIVSALDQGLAEAERTTGTTARLIFDIDREFRPAVGLDHVAQLVRLRRSNANGVDRVIGVGMDSTELGIDPTTYVDAYRAASATGLRLTAHQGENSPASAAAAAVDVLGCERVDHGITIIDDETLTARFADRRLPLTVCPNANARIVPDVFGDLAAHPSRRMRDAGLLVTLNTDDPATIALDLTQEYLLSAAAFGLGMDDLVEIATNAVEASWLDESDKPAMAARIREAAQPHGQSTFRRDSAGLPDRSAPLRSNADQRITPLQNDVARHRNGRDRTVRRPVIGPFSDRWPLAKPSVSSVPI